MTERCGYQLRRSRMRERLLAENLLALSRSGPLTRRCGEFSDHQGGRTQVIITAIFNGSENCQPLPQC
jgi:hypothetical protein